MERMQIAGPQTSGRDGGKTWQAVEAVSCRLGWGKLIPLIDQDSNEEDRNEATPTGADDKTPVFERLLDRVDNRVFRSLKEIILLSE